MDTQTQIDRLIELAIIQRSELKQLVEQLPQLREHLNAEVEKVFDETEPQLRAELEEWTTKQTADKTAALGVALEAKIAELAKSLEVSTQARYNAIIAEREENARLAAQAEAKIAEHAASLPGAVKEIVSAELARFPRAGEIDQLRKEFAEPRGLNPRGKWQVGETYNKLDLVTINGDSYTSNTDGNRTRPSRSSTDWTLVAARGTGGGGGPTSLSELTTVPSDGDLLIGSGTSWVTSNLTAGAGISITVGPGAITISATDGDITLDDGTAASPSLHFTNDPDTGIYRPAANTLGISVSGTQVAYFDENGLTVPSAGVVAGGSIHAGNGNANNPSLSFDGDQDTGFFRHQPNEIGIALGGTQYATLTSTTFSITPVVTMASSLRVNGTTDSSSKDTGAIVTEGGLGVEKSATFGGNLTVNGTATISSSLTSGTLTVNGTGYFNSSVTAQTLTDGYVTISAAQINRGGGGAVELQYAGGGNVRMFGATATPITFSSAGNLTVSGTGTTSVAGNLNFNGTGAATPPSGLNYGFFPQSGLGLGINSVAGGVGVWLAANGAFRLNSGTATNDYTGFEFTNATIGITGSSAYVRAIRTASSGSPTDLAFGIMASGTLAEAARFKSNGNFLIGTTTDGGQKLQVAGDLAANVGNGTSSALQLNQSGQVNWYVRNVATTGVLSIGNGGGDYLTFPKTSGTATLSNQVSTLSLSSTVASSSTTTGALVVSGGVGVAGAINAGGNLTVSGGTATISAASAQATLNLTSSGGSGRQYQLFSDATGQAGIFDATGSTFPLLITTTTLSTARNLTVSGTGNSSVAGTFLVATTTNSSNGKIQLADHTTSAGGIGFGTDTSLFRTSAGVLGISGAVNAAIELYGSAAGIKAITMFEAGTIAAQVSCVSGSFQLKTGSSPTTALTLDSSQNATFAGRMGIGGASVAASSLILRGLSLTTGATQIGIDQQTTFNSDATTSGRGISSVVVTKAASFTMANGVAFYAVTPVLGAGSAITTNTGLYVANQGSTGITNAYGIDIAAQSGAATTNVAIRAAGKIMFTSLPTSSVGLASGELWNDSGTVKIA